MLKQMLNGKLKFVAAAAVAALVGLPAIGQAAHYTGTVPASVMMAAATSSVRTVATHRKLTSARRTTRASALTHKKAVRTVKHKKSGKKKHHKKK